MTTKSVAGALRKTGISVIGDMPWGTHFCHFYETKQDLLDTLVPYFKAGLENNEFCLWVISEPLTEAEATGALRQAVPDLDRHLSGGSIEILPHDKWYLQGGGFNLLRVIHGWKEKLDAALASGYAGMRISGNTAWIHEKDWREFREYEKELNVLIADQRMIVLCTYPLAATAAAQILDVARIHQVAVARRSGQWEIVETPELKEAKAEIKRLNDELEQRVEERTKELATANGALKKEIHQRKQVEEKWRYSGEQLRALTARLESLREQERIRISREIHDELGQKLTGLKMDLLRAERKLEELEDSPAVNSLLDTLVSATELADGITATVQEIAADLRPGVLDKLGLGAALHYEGRRFQERTGVRCNVRLPEMEPAFSSELSTALFRIFQECLTNVARHAHASEVEAELKLEPGSVTLTVHDNGRGIAPTAMTSSGSLGLLGMKERAALLGGDILFERGPEKGTIVTVRIAQTRATAQIHEPV